MGKLYNEEKDEFDLTRVPDIHDNVRFDMLHNPRLGLTDTLAKLYNKAKLMADAVVPQEYGITIEQRRNIAQKMCGTLLDKIKGDLTIANWEDQVDVRYMLDLNHASDLQINTLGRRVRTRLYFTSESHLHTLLNVLRFPSPSGKPSLLSKRGKKYLNETPEFCYLTQVVIRLFENPTKDSADPNRFRVEILFSPGATATPLHMSEMFKDQDRTRFDTSRLEKISKDHITCQDLEDYFEEAIRMGKDGDEEEDVEMVGELTQKKVLRTTTNSEDNSLQKAMSGIFASKGL